MSAFGGKADVAISERDGGLFRLRVWHVTEVVLCLPPAENIYSNVKIIRFSDSRGLL